MPIWARYLVAGLAVVCGVLMAVLFLKEPVLTFYESDVSVSCHSIARSGWPGKQILDDPLSRSYNYDVSPDRNALNLSVSHIAKSPRWSLSDRMEVRCAIRRETDVAWMAILAVPTSVLAAVAIWGGRRGRPEHEGRDRVSPAGNEEQPS